MVDCLRSEIHTFLDRTDLVDTTLSTISRTIMEGIGLVILILIIVLGSWRGAACGTPSLSVDCFYIDASNQYPCQFAFIGRNRLGIIVDGPL